MPRKTFCYNSNMDKSILTEVIAAEKDVQRSIEQEEERLREWVEQVRHEAADAVAREEGTDGEALQQVIASARQDAEQRAQVMRDEAITAARRLDSLDDAALMNVIMKRLPRIFRE